MTFPRLSELTASVEQVQEVSQVTEARSGGDLAELIERYCDAHKLHSFESDSGVRKFEQIVKVLGYRGLSAFLADNSGAIEKMLEWIGSQRSPEWKEAFEIEVGPREADEDDAE